MRPCTQTLAVVPIDHWCLAASDLGPLRCVLCGEELEIHQPESTDPYRLLGTCPKCREWYVFDVTNEATTRFYRAPREPEFDRLDMDPGAAANGLPTRRMPGGD